MSKKTKHDDEGLAPQDSDQVQGPGIDHWPLLSDEVVLAILRYLPQKVLGTLSRVNKRMRDLSRDDSLWTEITLDYEDITQREGSCRDLVERCKKLASLKITHKENFFSSVSSNIMPVVIGAKNCLKSLEVDWSLNYWTDAAMCELSKMKGLRNLSFTMNSVQNPISVSNLAQLDQLEILKINYTRKILLPNISFHHWIKYVFQQLKKLKIVDLYLPGYAGSDDVLVALASNNPGLKVLRNRGGFCSVKSIEVLSNKCPDLEELHIKCSFGNSEEEFEKFSFPKLKHLSISHFYTLYLRLSTVGRLSIDETLTKLIEKHEFLKSFKLRGFSSVAQHREHGLSIFAKTESLIQDYRRKYTEINFMIED